MHPKRLPSPARGGLLKAVFNDGHRPSRALRRELHRRSVAHPSDQRHADYGMFVLVQSAITLLISGQMAWLVQSARRARSRQARRRLARPHGRRRRIQPAHVFCASAAAAALVVPVAWDTFRALSGPPSKPWWSTLGIAGVLDRVCKREYLRGVLLIYGRPHSMLRADTRQRGRPAWWVHSSRPTAPAGLRCLYAVGSAHPASALAGEAAALPRPVTTDPGFVMGDSSAVLEGNATVGHLGHHRGDDLLDL